MVPAAAPPLAPKRVSFDAFVSDPAFEGRFEWVDGEVFEMAPASIRHQIIQVLIVRLMTEWPKRSGRVLTAPCLMRLPERPSGREPDILFIRRERLHIERRNYLDGPADLVVEIVSPESEERDREQKRAEYERAGVREYWLISPTDGPTDGSALFLVLDDSGRYVERAPDGDGFYRSPTLGGMPLPVEWLWTRPDPEPGEIPALFAAELARLERLAKSEVAGAEPRNRRDAS